MFVCYYAHILLDSGLERMFSDSVDVIKAWTLESGSMPGPYCLLPQSCPTLCDPVDYSPPGSSVHGIFQARILEWVAISYSRGSSQSRDQTHISCISCIGRRIFFTTVPPGKPQD